jgi:hypothetical protein
MDNPYASPNPTNAFGGKNPTGLPAGGRERGLVGHVRVLGILMLVHGVLALLCGLLFIAMAIFFPMIFAAMEPPPNARAGEPSPEFIAGIAGGVYGTIGLITLIAGGLQIYAGYQTYLFRKRQLGIIALIVGVGASLSCYCSITAIGLLIYGLFVFLNASVKEAFELGAQGYPPDQIDAMFNPYTAR